MTSTYTSNPPSNATGFKAWLEARNPAPGDWRNCRYLVWGLGNTQWNAFLAFPRYVQQKLSELGATPLAELGLRRRGLAGVGAPGRGLEQPRLAGPARAVRGAARLTAAAARVAAEKAATAR